jgi:hypothetical protein
MSVDNVKNLKKVFFIADTSHRVSRTQIHTTAMRLAPKPTIYANSTSTSR